MIYIFVFLINLACSELIDYKISINSPNFFDKKYLILSKNYGDEKIFGYSDNEACFIQVNPRNLIAYTQELTTFKRSSSALFEFSAPHFKQIKIINCFNYNGNSYIIYKTKDKNETIIIKGKSSKKYLSNFNYEDIKYDYIAKLLYLLKDNIIYEIDMESFERIWDSVDDLMYGNLKINQISRNDEKATDLIIIGGFIYIIKEGHIFKRKINKKDYKLVTATNSDKFNFLFFEPKLNIKLGDSSKLNNFIIYGLELILIIIGLYILNFTRLLKKKKKEDFPILLEVLNEKEKDIQ